MYFISSDVLFFFQFNDRNLGLISTSVHLIKLLHGIQIKEELLLTGKAMDFVKYIVCTIFFHMGSLVVL